MTWTIEKISIYHFKQCSKINTQSCTGFTSRGKLGKQTKMVYKFKAISISFLVTVLNNATIHKKEHEKRS